MHNTDEGTAIVATFSERSAADAAIRALHDQSFRRTWLAVIDRSAARPDTFNATRDGLQRRWVRKDSPQSLYDALRDHGVTDDDALRLDDTVDDGCCILVAESANDPAYAQQIVASEGGALVSVPTPLQSNGAAPERDALRKKRTSIAPVVREEVFVCSEPRRVGSAP
jgi:hypothetical protein